MDVTATETVSGDEVASQEEDEEIEIDRLDAILFKNCGSLKVDKDKFVYLSKEQKMFVYLVSRHEKESTHVEFKTSMMSEDIDFRMLRSACSMYNGLQPDLREPSIAHSSQYSSYVLYGIEEEGRKCSFSKKTFCPLNHWKGEEEIQDLFNSSTLPTIEVYFHLVKFDSDLHFEATGTIPSGSYALLEIPKGECGPAYFKNKSRRKSANSRTNKPLMLYTRSDAKNLPEEEWTQTIHERVKKLFTKHYDASAMLLVKDKLESAYNYFRVLLLTRFSGVERDEDMNTLVRALGRGKWSIILDFDRNSRKPGNHCALIEEEMNKQGRLYTMKAWNELNEKIEIKDMEECQRGDRTLNIQTNGCELRSIKEEKNPAKVKKLIRSNALEPVFERNLTPKPVICLALFLTASVDDFLASTLRPDEIPSMLKDAYESESGNAKEFQLIALFTHECVKNSVKITDCSESFVSPANQISYVLDSLSPSDSSKQDYELPGISGRFLLSRESFACHKPYLRLYHIKSGQRSQSQLNEKQTEEREVSLIREFLAGSELTKEMLYANEQMEYRNSSKRVFVRRREIDKLKNRVKASLENSRDRTGASFNPWENQIVRLYHDPLSGATTIARAVLWQLREDYPCIEVKSIGKLKDIIDAVCIVFKDSGIPVLILFDSHTADFITVQTFVSELRLLQPTPKFIALFVEQVAPESSQSRSQATAQSRSHTVTMELNEEETKAFTAIYDSVGGDVTFEKFATEVGDETECTPFLFGVWYFKKDYRRIKEFVELLLTNIDDSKKKLLFFASLVQLFTHAPLDLTIAAHCGGTITCTGRS